MFESDLDDDFKKEYCGRRRSLAIEDIYSIFLRVVSTRCGQSEDVRSY